jgi:putative spermidine/putrescine transport system substrate-binding protein
MKIVGRSGMIGGAVTRRTLLKTAAAGTATIAAPMILRSMSREAAAAETVQIMGVETAAVDDWSEIEKNAGVTIEFTTMQDDPGVFKQEIVANEAGEKIDIFFLDGGVQDDPTFKGYFLPVDSAAIPNWATIPASIAHSPQIVSKDGVQYGAPLVFNADSFGYWPSEIGEAEPLSYGLLFESDKTKGKVALENTWLTTLPMAASYVGATGKAQIGDPANMTPAEAKTVVDFLVERKKAGQFRTLWSTYEESVDLLSKKEVIIENCWEPAAKELQRKGLPIKYAYTKEGYNKWMIGAFIAKQVKDRNNMDTVNKTINALLGPVYAAKIAILRGYATGNAALGLDYAKSHGLPQAQIDAISENIEKVDKKFTAKWFWQNAAPDHIDDIEAEWQRFQQA